MVVTALVLATAIVAAPNDFRLNATDAQNNGILFTGTTPNGQRWKRFTTELAYVLAPRLVGPAETLGYGGFQVASIWSANMVSASDGVWNVTERGRTEDGAAGVLQTLTLDVKKGLPFSFELGASFAWLAESNLFAPGLELRWALLEGYELAPEIGIRAGVTHLVGSRDLNLTNIDMGVLVSKGFGVGGVMHVAPYVGWTFMLVSASSRVIDPTPTVEADFGDNFVFPELAAGDNVHNRLTLGVRALFYILNISVQGDFEMLEQVPDDPADTRVEAPSHTDFFGSVGTVSVKLGLEY